LSLPIYLDDCAFSHRLRKMLIEAGHTVQIPADVDPPLTGAEDQIHFAYASKTGQIILTYNPKDFYILHKATPAHPGILAIYQDNDPSRDMSYADVVRAIANLQKVQPHLSDGFWILNHYRW
jgi:hypothetical protein